MKAGAGSAPPIPIKGRKGTMVTDPTERRGLAGFLNFACVILILIPGLANASPDLLGPAAAGNLPAARAAIKAGGDPNEVSAGGGTPLLLAIVNNHPEMVSWLLSNGADVQKSDGQGHLPLYWAVLYGRLEIVRELLRHGAGERGNASGRSGLIEESVCARAGPSCPRTKILAALSSRDPGLSGEDLQRIVRIAIRSATESSQPTGRTAKTNVTPDETAVSEIRFPPEALSRPDPRKYAVVVGIARYRAFPPSPYSDRDARSMVRRLVAVGTPENHILLLQGRRATKAALEGVFSRWLPRHLSGESRLVVYFSGNGASGGPAGPLLLPWDARRPLRAGDALSLDGLIAVFGGLGARHVTVLVDAGFTGKGDRSVGTGKGKRTKGPLPGNLALIWGGAGRPLHVDRSSRHGRLTGAWLRVLDRTGSRSTTGNLYRATGTLGSIEGASDRRF